MKRYYVSVSCFFFCKDTNYLANHNSVKDSYLDVVLFLLLQRY